jgi:hypothetical protein
MTDLKTGMVEKYRNNFLKEVEANVERRLGEDAYAMWCVLRLMSIRCTLGPAHHKNYS